jgi:hypothetical protein
MSESFAKPKAKGYDIKDIAVVYKADPPASDPETILGVAETLKVGYRVTWRSGQEDVILCVVTPDAEPELRVSDNILSLDTETRDTQLLTQLCTELYYHVGALVASKPEEPKRFTASNIHDLLTQLQDTPSNAGLLKA